jgi:hypothetical protein
MGLNVEFLLIHAKIGMTGKEDKDECESRYEWTKKTRQVVATHI